MARISQVRLSVSQVNDSTSLPTWPPGDCCNVFMVSTGQVCLQIHWYHLVVYQALLILRQCLDGTHRPDMSRKKTIVPHRPSGSLENAAVSRWHKQARYISGDTDITTLSTRLLQKPRQRLSGRRDIFSIPERDTTSWSTGMLLRVPQCFGGRQRPCLPLRATVSHYCLLECPLRLLNCLDGKYIRFSSNGRLQHSVAC
jgi:hypothetical protein